MISTKNVKEKGLPKVLLPGEHVCKIVSIQLEKSPFRPGALHINLNVEGPDLGDKFEGFYIDKNNPSKGRHKGQVGRVRAGAYPFSDNADLGIVRDKQIEAFVAKLLKVCKFTDGIEGQTVEEFIENLNKVAPYKGIFFRMCIAGREYKNRDGYNNYDLYLPKAGKDAKGKFKSEYAFEAESVPQAMSKLIKFDKTLHITKKEKNEPDQVETFVPDRPVTDATKEQFSFE